MTRDKLRIGLLIDSYILPAWVIYMVKKLQHDNSCEIVLVIRNNTVENLSLFQKIKKSINTIFYNAYRIIEKKTFKSAPDAFKQADIRDVGIGFQEVAVNPKKGKFTDTIVDDDVEKIKEHNVDILIRLGFRILKGNILKVARFGIWSYHHGDNAVNRGGPAGVWESILGWSEQGSILQILNEKLDAGTILAKSWSSVDKWNLNRSINNFYWKSANMLPRMVNRLYLMGEEAFFDSVNQSVQPTFYSHPLFTKPENGTFLLFCLKKAGAILKRFTYKLFFIEQWQLRYKLRKSEENGFDEALYSYKSLVPKKDRFWADPFIVEDNNKYFLFFEELEYKDNKGYISVLEIGEDNNISNSQKVLERPYHLSYPFILKIEGDYYMIPETKANKTIELYKCIKFPNEWVHHSNLIEDIVAVDATILFYNQKYWMFANVEANKGMSSHDELHIFYSNDVFSKNWTPHLCNPVVSDVRKARPAGNIFEYGGNLYRPSQDSSKRYGGAIKINKILKLDEYSYLEETITDVTPSWDKNLLAAHTFNKIKKLSVIDVLVKRRRFF